MATHRPPYATPPTLVDDVLMWLLPPREYLCLRYILRHTYGYRDTQGAHKERDLIALSQFEDGIRSGPYLIDGGTGLSRNSIKQALRGLEEKGLLDTRYACSRCLWEQAAGTETPPTPEGHSAPACPRCGRTLSQSYAVAELRPSRLVALLNQYDPQKHQWRWDEQKSRFYAGEVAVAAAAAESVRKAEAEAQAREQWAQLWHPELVADAIRQARRHRKSEFPHAILLKHFIQPVLVLQERYPAPLVEEALRRTVGKHIPDNEKYESWSRYAAAICKRLASQFSGHARPGTPAAAEATTQEHARAARDLLQRASVLNSRSEREAAHAILSELLSMADKLAPLYKNSEADAENQLKLAFKQGVTDLHVRRNRYGIDFYPEWTPPGEVPLGEPTRKPAAAGAAPTTIEP